jgi:hemerythrin
MPKHFELGSEYIFGIKEIDEQHQAFIALLEKVYDSLLKMEGAKVIVNNLTELINYAKMHFETEEKYFDEFHYDGALEHKAEHVKLAEQAVAFKEGFKNGTLKDPFAVVDFMEDWLIHHLLEMDKKYVACFKEHGLK